MAHAVPPMPEAPGRASTEHDQRLGESMRTTDHQVVVDPMASTAKHPSQNLDATLGSLSTDLMPAQPSARIDVPRSTAPSSLSPPRSSETVESGPTPACPQCDSPMSWVEEHLRFYCRHCRMYF
jgi:hypothetical protein